MDCCIVCRPAFAIGTEITPVGSLEMEDRDAVRVTFAKLPFVKGAVSCDDGDKHVLVEGAIFPLCGTSRHLLCHFFQERYSALVTIFGLGNHLTGWGDTALSCAAAAGHLPVLKCLLNHNADINARTLRGRQKNILCEALSQPSTFLSNLSGDHLAVAEYIAEHPDFLLLNDPSCGSFNPMMLAASKSAPRVIQILLQRGVPIETRNSNSETVLMVAAENGNAECAALLCKHGADTAARDAKGDTPLMLAAQSRRNTAEVVETLVLHGADLHAKNGNNTSLMMAAKQGNHKAVERLLHCGARVEDKLTKSALDGALLGAINSGCVSAAISIIRSGASVGPSDPKKPPPLWTAASENLVDVVVELLHHGADPNTRNNCGEEVYVTPLMIAAQKGNVEIMKLLVHHGASTCQNIMAIAAEHQQRQALQYLIALGLNPSDNDKRCTPLMVAAKVATSSTIQLLLHCGANINYMERLTGWTALTFAAYNCYHDTARQLIQNGAIVNVMDNNGTSPLYLASVEGWDDRVIYELLYPFHLEERRKMASIL